jgi:ATP-dependent helicase/nuclease subunit B
VDFERRRRPGAFMLVEQKGETSFDTPAGPFTLSARADRIEVRGPMADIVDFKTGAPPSKKQVTSGIAPQLTLTAAILARDGFTGAAGLTPNELLYVRVGGGRVPGSEERRDEGEAPAMAEEAFARLQALVERFDNPGTPYPSWQMPQYIARYGGDYDHLARLWEWYVLGEDGEAEA